MHYYSTGVKMASFGEILIDCKHQKRCPGFKINSLYLDTLLHKPIELGC